MRAKCSHNMNDNSTPKYWYKRGFLPHYDGGQIPQFITFRLADSLPRHILEGYKLQYEKKLISEVEYYRILDKYLDLGNGASYLRHESVASIVEENILRFDAEKYRLFSWVIMPNHVHVLLSPLENMPLASVMHSMKSFTANQANRLLGRRGRFWSVEYFDRYIRNHEHFENTVTYIENNPVKAGLCRVPSEWRFGSARMKF
jgi:REP element-mobilizing transposase RayT